MSKARTWLDERGYRDGQSAAAERELAEAVRRGSEAEDPTPCRWHVYDSDGNRTTLPGYAWRSDWSGVVLTEAYWDLVERGQDSAGQRVVGPM